LISSALSTGLPTTPKSCLGGGRSRKRSKSIEMPKEGSRMS
jgi:hypothetical protein